MLDLRFCELGITLEGSPLEMMVALLSRDLERRGLSFRPHVWLSNEWFSPIDVPGFALPFYLAHPRLRQLERRQMLEVEGGTRRECRRILRHECGHALSHAYGLHRRRRFRELFGRSGQAYPEAYAPDPTSRDFVQHLRAYYAQSHPDEDFAETFAVWMQPRHVWRKRYADWPALRKLEYVDALMGEIATQPPKLRTRRRVDPISSSRKTLREHYEERREAYPPQAGTLYDRHLRQLFGPDPIPGTGRAASSFLRAHRADIRSQVARWTGEYQAALDQVLEDMIRRCRELKLRAVGDEDELRNDCAVMLTVNVMHFLYNKKQWHAL
ncbi:MAG: hypothetical protein DHS20C15_06530 [Planctomycetota bacterium]|nr:MAG: hypothetical protein DHS20C15_06530 [Planctomycetota bacterium]